MAASPPTRRTHVAGMPLLLAFTAVVGSFFASNYIVQRSTGEIATLSQNIIENAAPSIEHMARVRRGVLEAELALAHFIDEPERRAEHAKTLEAALLETKQTMREYLAISPYPEEQRARLDLQEAFVQFDDAARDARRVAESQPADAARAVLTRNVEPARRTLLEEATGIIEANASRGRAIAHSIQQMRQRSLHLANVLNAVCGLLALVVGWLVHRQAVSRRALADAQLEAVEQRATELEQFAGRVAHDIRNPLAAARAAAELATRRAGDDASRELNQRIIRSLSRADAITTDLLGFARSGAKPDPGARTAPQLAIAEVVSDVAVDAERAGIEIEVDRVPAVAVVCSTGVYLSLVGNLVRNSVKYMRDAPTRRITIRVREEGDLVRTEVADTGPGIAADLLPSLFEPYFRGATRGAEGLGLGLATVKRLAEAHGGSVGVTSQRGVGSTFWFTLRRASLDALDTLDPEEAEREAVRH